MRSVDLGAGDDGNAVGRRTRGGMGRSVSLSDTVQLGHIIREL